MTVSPAIPDFASLMGVEIDMFEDKHTIPAGAGRNMVVVETVPAVNDPKLFQDIRAAAKEEGLNARTILPNKVPGDNTDPKGIDVYIVLHGDGKYRTSLGRNGLLGAPKEEPVFISPKVKAQQAAEAAATAQLAESFAASLQQGTTRAKVPMKTVRFKKPEGIKP